MELQVQWWIETKLKGQTINFYTAHRYVKNLRQVFKAIGQAYDDFTLAEYQKALKRNGSGPEHQAEPATLQDVEATEPYLSESEFIGLLTSWFSSSRLGEIPPLMADHFQRVFSVIEGVEKTLWAITFPYHKGDPFRLGTTIVVDFGKFEPRISAYHERLGGGTTPGVRWSTITTDRAASVLGQVRQGLTAQSIKRGALLKMLHSGVPLSLIQAMAKHKDLETLLIYLPRLDVAMSLRVWEATICLSS